MLEATFADGTVKRYDVEPLLSRWKAFEALRDVPGLFRSVRVDAGGYGVVWNDELDLECEEIWNNGVSVSGLDRRITGREYARVRDHMLALDLPGFLQEPDSADRDFIPTFNREESFV